MKKQKLVKVIKAGILGSMAYEEFKKKTRKRRFWVRELYLKRSTEEMYETTFDVLSRDLEMFFQAVRMTLENFSFLLNILEEKLTKSSIRRPISAKCRLFLTILYLAHGGARKIFAISFRIAPSTIGKIILETCKAIWDELHGIYLAVPNTVEWNRIAKKFEETCGLPNCIGAIDGKHVTITCPPNAGSQYFNYKKRHSIVLLAVCDYDYTFVLVNVGAYGSQSDGGVFKNSKFGTALDRNQLGVPASWILPNSTINFPYFLVGDAAFSLKKYLMRPFSGKNLSAEKLNFNKRTSRGRVVVENTFGILACRWRVLRNYLHCSPENAETIVKAALVLHNFLRISDIMYCPINYGDQFVGDEVVPGEWREGNFRLRSLHETTPNNASHESFQLRNVLCEYLQGN